MVARDLALSQSARGSRLMGSGILTTWGKPGPCDVKPCNTWNHEIFRLSGPYVYLFPHGTQTFCTV